MDSKRGWFAPAVVVGMGAIIVTLALAALGGYRSSVTVSTNQEAQTALIGTMVAEIKGLRTDLSTLAGEVKAIGAVQGSRTERFTRIEGDIRDLQRKPKG